MARGSQIESRTLTRPTRSVPGDPVCAEVCADPAIAVIALPVSVSWCTSSAGCYRGWSAGHGDPGGRAVRCVPTHRDDSLARVDTQRHAAVIVGELRGGEREGGCADGTGSQFEDHPVRKL